MVNQQHKNLEKFILSDADLKDEFSSSFLDPGVSNTDVDWLFRGREVKKLSKRSTNTISNEVQSHLLHAQQKALIQSMGNDNDNSIVDNSINLPSSITSTISTSASPVPIPLKNDTPLKSSLKSSASTSSLRIDTSMFSNSPSYNAITSSTNSPYDQQSLNSYKSASSFLSTTPNSHLSNPSTSTPNPTPTSTPVSTPISTSATRSRSSSLFGRQKSPSNASETKPAKKSLLSALSSKLKSTQSPISPTSIKSASPSPVASRSVTPKNSTLSTTSVNQSSPFQQLEQQQQSTLPSNKKQKPNLLDDISFKRVCFALDELIEDPQQQIPSRRPKKGNVLIPEDMLAPPPKLSIGITNSFNEQTKDKKPVVDPKLYEQAIARQRFFLTESKKHSEEAHIAALRMAKEVSSFKKRKNSFLRSDDEESDEEENITDSRFMNKDDSLDIDTPLHEHVNYFGNDTSPNSNPTDDVNLEISLETLYTRCCHLREILPIPATLKQLKDKSRPLHVLKMLNPKPTLIDILSFSDFLSVAPVINVIFDNVTIDTEMLKIILVSLKNSKYLDKLSLRNVPIDNEGWNYVCKFLEINKNIQKLDISQQKIKKPNDGNSKSILRNELDWNLFTETLISRRGIEELVINGCNLNNKDFETLVNKGLILKTKKLGLASSQLDNQKMEILMNWISMKTSKCIGVDFAFNNLSVGQIKILNNAIKLNYSNINLQFLSLNSTDIDLNECSELIKNLASLKSLRYLDLSNNPHLFPDIIPILRDNLPNYPDLRRIHFDFDSLTEFSIVQLCLIFQKCAKLVHVSILGNQAVSSKIVSALYSAVKNSHIYNIDMDYDGLDEELVSRIAFFLMRNMESFLNANSKKSKPTYKPTKSSAGSDISTKTTATTDLNAKDDDLIFDGSLLTKAAEHLLETDLEIVGEERLIIFKSLIEKTIKLRHEIHDAMNRLFEAREKGKLSIEGKENLLRFCLLDDSLENIFTIFADEIKLNDNDKNHLLNFNNDNNNIDHISRPSMMRNLSSQLIRHHSTDSVIKNNSHDFNEETNSHVPSEDPHIVVADADSVPVDSTTGKRVLMRKFSQTSVHAKKLEEEEGELHRWGFFVQQQNDIMPDDSQNSNIIVNDPVINDNAKREEEEKLAKEMERLRLEAEEKERLRVENEANEKRKLKINAIPSGSELRETIMKAKGIESISDLIKKVNKDFTTVEKIYKHVDAKRVPREVSPIVESPTTENPSNSSEIKLTSNSNSNSNISIVNNLNNHSDSILIDGDTLSPTISHNSLSDGEIIGQADEVYERILNNVIRVRSNKNE